MAGERPAHAHHGRFVVKDSRSLDGHDCFHSAKTADGTGVKTADKSRKDARDDADDSRTVPVAPIKPLPPRIFEGTS
jgi:hypothetical protein